jgi:riboflavin synthase alpha subunit
MKREHIIWTGSAFDCSSTTNEIVLLYTRYNTETYVLCNNGFIVARGLSVEGNNYTSQLNVTITPDTAGETIICASDNGTRYKHLFTSTIPTITG